MQIADNTKQAGCFFFFFFLLTKPYLFYPKTGKIHLISALAPKFPAILVDLYIILITFAEPFGA